MSDELLEKLKQLAEQASGSKWHPIINNLEYHLGLGDVGEDASEVLGPFYEILYPEDVVAMIKELRALRKVAESAKSYIAGDMMALKSLMKALHQKEQEDE